MLWYRARRRDHRKLQASYHLFEKYNPLFIDAIMLTNHDQDRIGSVVGNYIAKIKLAASILLTLPGQPYIYYGEEIGMLGTKPDPYIREPFLWSKTRKILSILIGSTHSFRPASG
jgi:alpha-amylase